MPRSLWLAIAIALVITSVPSLAGMLFAPQGGSWTAILTRNAADVNGYLSMIEEARQGSWRMRNLFTAERHEPFQIRPLWLLIGLAGRMLPMVSNVVLMEAARLFTSLFLLLMIAALTLRLFQSSRERFIAFWVISFGSGLGWLRLVNDPPDLRIVETSTFLTLVSPPLYSLSLGLLLAVFLLIERAWNHETQRTRDALFAGGCALWLGLDRPFSSFTLFLSIIIFMAIHWSRNREIRSKFLILFPFVIGLALSIGYQFLSIQSIPVYAEWNRQHILPTPGWLQLVSSLGPLIPLALFGSAKFYRTNSVFATLAAAYIGSSLLLSHLPFGFQERFLEGLPVMVAMFASFGLLHLLSRIQTPVAYTPAATIGIVVLSLSHYLPVRSDLAAIARQSPPQYMPDGVLNAMRRLKFLAGSEEAILSTEATGNFLIAYSGRPVVLGQKIQTARYPEKWNLVHQYFSTPGHVPRSRQLFEQTRAKWLFWGPEEAWLARGRFHPAQASYLEEKHNDGFIRIFKLK
jgi:hypothetical protein